MKRSSPIAKAPGPSAQAGRQAGQSWRGHFPPGPAGSRVGGDAFKVPWLGTHRIAVHHHGSMVLAMQTYTPVPGMGSNSQPFPQTAPSPISPSSYAQMPMYRQGSPSHPPVPPQAQPIQQQLPSQPMGMSMHPQQTGATAAGGAGRSNQAPAPFVQPMPLLDNCK